jgi:hypothetical protein
LIYDRADLAMAILQKQPDCSLEDEHGNNVLHKLHLGHQPLIELAHQMIACGANPHRENRHGVSAVRSCVDHAELRELMANIQPPERRDG